MNRTIRNLIVAAPLATIALTIVPVGAANAGPNGPVIIIQSNGGDPEPNPPKGPQDKAPVPQPKGPQDKAPLPQDDAPDDKAPKPQPQPQPNGGAQTFPSVDADEAPTKKADKTDKTDEDFFGATTPDSVDDNHNPFAGSEFEVELVAAETDGGLDMTWLLVGGSIVTVSGIAFAARKRTNA